MKFINKLNIIPNSPWLFLPFDSWSYEASYAILYPIHFWTMSEDLIGIPKIDIDTLWSTSIYLNESTFNVWALKSVTPIVADFL